MLPYDKCNLVCFFSAIALLKAMLNLSGEQCAIELGLDVGGYSATLRSSWRAPWRSCSRGPRSVDDNVKQLK
jgi:hypothetical protein